MRISWLSVILFFMFLFGIFYIYNEIHNVWWKSPSLILCHVGLVACFMSFIGYVDSDKKIKIKK